ncbi:PH domain-containing protein [Corynebacterium cystitidis]|uniref:PH domain-containing protein n=1 Tax=Corynebacterium cystitidis TaxID=35757 RepID=UPI00211E6C03|nr:PH domain-containing protein [Corynebacterium cystitidis]
MRTGNYRRVHRLTPLLRFWTLILALLAVAAANLNQAVVRRLSEAIRGEDGSFLPLLIGTGGFVGVCVAVFLVSQIWWAATGFRLDAEEVRLKRGVISTQLRTARYDRIQAVDVVEPLIARIFRLAAVRIETAGGASSAIEIAYLPRAEAETLRHELLGTAPVDTCDAVAQTDSDYVIGPIPIWRSLVGTALRLSTMLGVAWVLFALLAPISFATALPLIVGLVPSVWGMIDKSWRFNAVFDTDQVLHLAYGLASRRRQAVPLARIHAVSISQPVLWRLLGWWTVSVSVAGYGRESNKQSGTTRVLPVGSREQAMHIASVVSELSRVDLEAVAAPEEVVQPTYCSPRRAFLVSPLDAHRQATTLYRQFVVVHSGWVSRRVAFINSSHIQELTLRRGPIQNLVGLATVRFDLVPGPVKMAGRDMDAAQARELVDVLRNRALPELEAPMLSA